MFRFVQPTVPPAESNDIKVENDLKDLQDDFRLNQIIFFFLGGVEVPDEPEHQTALEIEKLQGQVQGDPDHDYDNDKSNDGFDEEGEITLLSKSR